MIFIGFSGFGARYPSRSEPELHFDVGLPGKCLEKGVKNVTAVGKHSSIC